MAQMRLRRSRAVSVHSFRFGGSSLPLRCVRFGAPDWSAHSVRPVDCRRHRLAGSPKQPVVSSPSTAIVSNVATSGAFAQQVVTELSKSAPPATTSSIGGDNVFDAVRIPWTRVQLGVASQRADQAAFADPQWADAVARSIYAAIGKLYGVVKAK
jgi:N-acetylmuramoyl-L-alanine amidase